MTPEIKQKLEKDAADYTEKTCSVIDFGGAIQSVKSKTYQTYVTAQALILTNPGEWGLYTREEVIALLIEQDSAALLGDDAPDKDYYANWLDNQPKPSPVKDKP